MRITTISRLSEKTVAALIFNELSQNGLIKLDYDEWIKVRAIGDLFFQSTAKAPTDIEIAYRAMCQLPYVAKIPYDKFCRHYLYRRFLKNILSIKPFIDSFGFNEDYTKQISFWRESFRLLTRKLTQREIPPSMSAYIGWVPYLPAIWKNAYPGIENAEYRNLIINQK